MFLGCFLRFIYFRGREQGKGQRERGRENPEADSAEWGA